MLPLPCFREIMLYCESWKGLRDNHSQSLVSLAWTQRLIKQVLDSLYFLCMSVLSAPHAYSKHRSEKGIGCPASGFTDGFEPPWGCREPNQSPLQEQQVLLTMESSSRHSATFNICRFRNRVKASFLATGILNVSDPRKTLSVSWVIPHWGVSTCAPISMVVSLSKSALNISFVCLFVFLWVRIFTYSFKSCHWYIINTPPATSDRPNTV